MLLKVFTPCVLEVVLVKVKGWSSATDKTAAFKIIPSFCCPCLNTDVEKLGSPWDCAGF